MNEQDVERILERERLPGSEIRELRCAAHCPDRFAFAVDERWVVKSFGPDEVRHFEIEEKLSRVLHAQGVPAPEAVASRSEEGGRSYIVFRHAEGRPLHEVHQALSLKEYTAMVASMAEVFGRLHALPLDLFDGLPFFERGHAQYFNLSFRRASPAEDTVQALMDEGALRPSAIALCELFERERDALFRSSPALIHGDIHNENVFLHRTEQSLGCGFIDWETARIEPCELDFVHPFLNIVAEAFPGRRFGDAVRPGPGNSLLTAFDRAYGRTIRWDHVAIHGAATYLDWALAAHRGGRLRARDFHLRTALGGLAFVGLSAMGGLLADP